MGLQTAGPVSTEASAEPFSCARDPFAGAEGEPLQATQRRIKVDPSQRKFAIWFAIQGKQRTSELSRNEAESFQNIESFQRTASKDQGANRLPKTAPFFTFVLKKMNSRDPRFPSTSPLEKTESATEWNSRTKVP